MSAKSKLRKKAQRKQDTAAFEALYRIAGYHVACEWLAARPHIVAIACPCGQAFERLMADEGPTGWNARYKAAEHADDRPRMDALNDEYAAARKSCPCWPGDCKGWVKVEWMEKDVVIGGERIHAKGYVFAASAPPPTS